MNLGESMRSLWHRRKLRFAALLFFTWGLYFLWLFARMMSVRDDGLWMGHENCWSDWALHVGLSTIFATKSPSLWFAYHPVFADGKLTYAFLTNLISAMLQRLGFSLSASFIFPSMVYSVLLLGGMYALYRLLLRSGRKALLAISLFLLAAGFGFVDFLGEFAKDPALLHLFYPPKHYGRLDSHQWYAGNFIVGMLLPQRAFLLGMTLAVWSLGGLLHVVFGLRAPGSRFGVRERRILVVSGVAAGLLPIAHMHSLIVMSVVLPPFLLHFYRDWRKLLYFAIPGAVLAVFLFGIFIYGGIQRQGFMSWHPGYTSQGFTEWLWFWGRSWGLMIPLGIWGFFRMRGKFRRELRTLFVGFFVIFVLGNLIHFQPIAWDNSKLFLWTYFALAGLATHPIVFFWRAKPRLRPVVGVVLFLLTATGFLEVERLSHVQRNSHRLLSREELDLADRVREETAPLDRFLTATIHNHLIMVRAARPILLAFTPWALNFGFKHEETEADIKKIYSGDGTEPLLKKHKVSYVVIGPSEIHAFHPSADFLKGFPVPFQTANYRIIDVRSLLR